MYIKSLLLTLILLSLTISPGLPADLRFHPSGKFKIIQITDTHLSFDGANSRKAKQRITMLAHILDVERPDLVILTGDIVSGKPYHRGIEMFAKILSARNLPWALVFGNHDPEQDLTYQQMSDLLERQPGYIGMMQPLDGVDGYGNYALQVKDPTGQRTEAVLYCLDSHQYPQLPDGKYDPGRITFSQQLWYSRLSDQFTRANGGKPLPSLAFFHIPTPEYRLAYREQGHKLVGRHFEEVCASTINSGFFTLMTEKKDVMGVFVGHDHLNDYIFNYYGIALAYGRLSANFSKEMPLGARLIELTEGRHSFRTWIRLFKNDAILDELNFPEDLPMKK